jgi:hypothetical protein
MEQPAGEMEFLTQAVLFHKNKRIFSADKKLTVL